MYAQPSPEKGKWSIEGDVFFGNILKPDDLVREILRRGLVHTYDLKVGYTDLQPSTYTSGYNYPRLGLGVSMLDCSDVKMWKEPSLGDIYALYLFFDRTLYRSKRFQFGYTLSSGPAYNTDTYDQEKAPTKIFSSSPVMIYIGYGMSLKYRLSDRLAIGANAEVKHYSNGRTGIMNKGINMAGGSLSMQYSFSPAESEYPPFVASPFKRYFYYHLMAGGGVQTYLEDLEVYWRTGPSESGLFKEKLYSKYFVSADAMYRFSSFYGCGMGVDLFYIPHTTSFRKMDEIFLGEDAAGLKYNSWSIGTAFNQELYYNQFSLTASLGYYLYRELGARKDESPLYQRFGLRYYLPKVNNLFAGFAIKAHEFSKAEYFEFSVGKKF
ncbi:hypothetical protein FACS189440_20360 [Bacteroidia bacterium]|nr:hypothetical protein FACS189423_06720 [Bacteroidia bacterium]GHT51403.1 hypothetical protein FACS189440_20360 [Bacteroidia bacterium]